jgi:hypothetical protein
MAMADNLQLYYGDTSVGQIKNAFCTDETWYGTLDLGVSGPDRWLVRRIESYISFVTDWNERLRRDDPADPSEFDEYSDLIKSGLWFTKDRYGAVAHIREAPVFFIRNEVTWRT